MVEFFQSIWNWIVTNKDNIVAFVTSTNFVALLSALVLLVKQIKSNKATTSTMDKVMSPLYEVSKLNSAVEQSSVTSTVALNNTEQLKIKTAAMEQQFTEAFDLIQQKIDAMLEVQSIVYSSIKDDTVRKNVANIITTAKLASTATKAELERQLEELKSQIVAKAEDVKTAVTDVTDKVKKTVSTKKSTSSRY